MENTDFGTPAMRPMKCVSWTCRSTAGPPVASASAMVALQSGLAMTRVKCPPSSLPNRPPRTASAANANSGKNGRTCATISSLPAVFAAASIASASAVVRAMAFSTSTCFPAFSAAMAIGACRSVTVQMSMRSMSGSASMWSNVSYLATALKSIIAPGGPKLPRMPRQSPASLALSRLQIAATVAPVSRRPAR